MTKLVVVFTVALVMAGVCQAGEVVTSTTHSKTFLGNAAGKHVIYSDGHRLRMETHLKGKLQSVTIIDAKREEMIAYDTSDKKYVRMTATQFNEIARSASKALAQLQARMKPNERQAMQALTKGLVDSATNYAASIDFKLVKKNIKSGNFECDRYDGFAEGKKVSSLCLMPDSWFSSVSRTLGRVRNSQLQAFKVFGASNELAKKFGLEKLAHSKISQKGYPIQSETSGMLGESKVQVLSVESKALDASLFAPPKGYQEKKVQGAAFAG